MLIFISGSSGSGKSLYAEERLLALSGNAQAHDRVYLATSEIYDDEMKARVMRHRLMRSGKGFRTIERTHDIREIAVNHNSCVLLEDLANLTANELFGNNASSEKIFADIMNIYSRCLHLVIVSCEVFSDCKNYDALTENYVRELARLHIKIARVSDEVTEVISGIPVQYNI